MPTQREINAGLRFYSNKLREADRERIKWAQREKAIDALRRKLFEQANEAARLRAEAEKQVKKASEGLAKMKQEIAKD